MENDPVSWTRRDVLQTAAAIGGTVLLPGGATAQNLATVLLRAPKQALIIGNSSYKRAPLRNPGNDAKGMAEALKAIGFDVVLGMDLGQTAMNELIQAYVDRLSRMKAVGLFYFAGHGTQLAWRNYIVPLDAEIASVELIKERCIDINTLIAGIRKAGNPMNVIILDACRDSPFGSQVQLDQKGLSQLDAPPGTLLAYATAPGNTAIDGEGVNGLYTEHLLREIRVPETKIEDVFKRVRLGVRRGSRGLQIPWESTSLEQDFYFVPPRTLATLAQEEAERERKQEMALLEKRRAADEAERKRKHELALKEAQRVAEEVERKRREEQVLREAKLAEEEAERKYKQELALREKHRAQEDAERQRAQQAALIKKPDPALAERQFEEELAIWEKIKVANDPEPLEDYLRRYPSGRFSELAQLRLDQALLRQGEKKVQIISSPENPYSKGTVAANTAYKVGDSYSYIPVDTLTKLEGKPYTRSVTGITDTEVIFNSGNYVTDLLGNRLKIGSLIFSAHQLVPTEFVVGKRWSTRYRATSRVIYSADLELVIAGRERITVPAGTFYAFRVEASGWFRYPQYSVSGDLKSWYAPEQVRQPIAWAYLNMTSSDGYRRGFGNTGGAKLLSFSQS